MFIDEIGLVRPAEGGGRPQGRGEPGIEHILVAGQRDAVASLCLRLFLRHRHIGFAVGVIPRRDPVTPPQLAADAPGLDVFHPVEEGLLPALRHDFDCAALHGFDRLLRQRFGIDIPLVGQPGFDHHAAAVAERRRDGARFGIVLDSVAFLVLRDMRNEAIQFLQSPDDQFACAVHAVALEAVKAEEFLRHQPVRCLADIGFAIEHVEHVGWLEPGALADFEIVEVVARRDLDRARPEFGIGMFVRDDGHAAARDRQHDMLAHDRCVTRVVGMHGNRHVGQHGFGPRGGDFDVIAPVGQRHTVFERISEVPETALHILRLDLEIGNRGLQLGVPIDQPLVAIDQPVLVQVDEGLEHGLRKMIVHRELFAAPVHRTTQTAQLAGDRAAAFFLPFPHLRDEILARIIGAFVLIGLELAFHHHLRGDARVIGADHPQCILAAQPFVTDHHVLQRIVERVADMQAAGHIGRRVYDGIGFGLRAVGAEQALSFPMRVPARLDFGGIECFR